MTRIKIASLMLSVAALLVACGGAIDSGSGDAPNNLGGASADGQTDNGQAGAAGGGSVVGKACQTPYDCSAPAVACPSGIGSPYAATCTDGVCGLESVPCPPPDAACGPWGCCTVASDCKKGPTVGPCPDGSSPGEMVCDAGVCGYHSKSCPTTGKGGGPGQGGAGGGAGACASDPPVGAMKIGLGDACDACASAMSGPSTSDPALDCGAVDAACQGDCACRAARSCVGGQMVVNGKSLGCAVAACSTQLSKAPASAALVTCLKDQCAAACGFAPSDAPTCQ